MERLADDKILSEVDRLAPSRLKGNWEEAVAAITKLAAPEVLGLLLRHPDEDVQIYALRGLRKGGTPAQLSTLLIYTHYVAVEEFGSENATIHGILLGELQQTVARLTDIAAESSSPESLQRALPRWWQFWAEQQQR